MYDDIYQMEPLWPQDKSKQLEGLATDIIRNAAELSSSVHPVTAHTIANFVRNMNCYYSNLIEGHNTHPIDIERALKGDYSQEPAKRALQLEAKSHIAVQLSIEQRLAAEPTLDIFTKDFLCWLHYELYRDMPSEFLTVHDNEGAVVRTIEPGVLRVDDVKVGHHIAPSAQALAKFITRFHQAYTAEGITDIKAIMGLAASHHRLAWIHPFLDGNGRVARLFSDTLMAKLRLSAHGLWTISRGLARSRDQYFKMLAMADQKKINDYDGRGFLSDRGLQSFCEFFLEVALDQINFMKKSLALTEVKQRLTAYAQRQIAVGDLMAGAEMVLPQLFAFGEVGRGEIKMYADSSERTARRLIKQLLDKGLALSSSAKGPLRLGLPISMVPYLFPRLIPETIEVDLL